MKSKISIFSAGSIAFDRVSRFAEDTIRAAKLLAVENGIIKKAFILVESIPVITSEAVAVGRVEGGAQLVGKEAVTSGDVVARVAAKAKVHEVVDEAVRVLAFHHLLHALPAPRVVERSALVADAIIVVGQAVRVSPHATPCRV
jgi:hypothetical protein